MRKTEWRAIIERHGDRTLVSDIKSDNVFELLESMYEKTRSMARTPLSEEEREQSKKRTEMANERLTQVDAEIAQQAARKTEGEG